MGDNEPIVEVEGAEESSNRTFMLLALGLGALFILGLICIVAVFFLQRNQGNTQSVNQTIAARNATVIAGATRAAQPSATPAPTETLLPSATPAPTDTSTPVVVSTPTTTETAPPTVAGTPGKTATPTRTTVPSRTVAPTRTTGPSRTPAAIAANQTPGAFSETATAEAGTTPQSGIGGVGWVAAAGVLAAALFIARRLRLAQR